MDIRIAVNGPMKRLASLGLAVVALACGSAKAASTSSAGEPVAQLPPPVLDAREVLPGAKAPKAGEMRNPDAGDPKAAKAGGALFSTMNCDGCHGGGATGWVGPSLVDGRWRYGGADGNIFQSIYYGRPNGMPAYGGILPASSIWAIVTYIRSQPLPPDVPTEAWRGGKKK